MPALYLEDLKLLIDTPEDIFNTLEKHKIDDIDYLSLSHKDPDHVRGIRLVEGMYFNWKNEVPKKTINFLALPVVVDEVNEMNGKKLIYACCNSKPFRDFKLYNNADVLIISMVDLTKINDSNRETYKFDNELFTIQEIQELKKKYNIKKVICTHLDCNWSNTYKRLKEYEKQLNGIEFAYDGMEINL